MAKPLDEQGRPLTYDHLKSRKKPRFGYVPLVLDQEVGDEYDKVLKELKMQEAVQARRPSLETEESIEELKGRLEELEAELEAVTVVFKFRSIGGDRVDALIEEHPPTAKQRKKAEGKEGGEPSWNPETFPQALVAACVVDPELSLEDVQDMWKSDDWTSPELNLLFTTAMGVNTAVRTHQSAKKG